MSERHHPVRVITVPNLTQGCLDVGHVDQPSPVVDGQPHPVEFRDH